MKLPGGFELSLRRNAAPVAARSLSGARVDGGWRRVGIVHEPYTGAWQRNDEIAVADVLSNPYVFACIRQISKDIGKLGLRLMQREATGIWTETSNPAYSPVLRTPNTYQTINQFIEQWLISLLTHGNTYVLKSRDRRGVVDQLDVLNPADVRVLVTPSGDVYYELTGDELLALGLPDEARYVPASEMIHDRYLCLYHRLIGVGPLYAAALAAKQGLEMQVTSTGFFANGAKPSGVILVPGPIDDDKAKEIKTLWDTNYNNTAAGKVGGTAVLSENMTYQVLTMTAVDAQLIEQLDWTGKTICTAFGVPISMIDESKGSPNYSSAEPRVQQYYAQCLQTQMNAIEHLLDAGLELPLDLGTEFDPDDLIWLDTATRTKAAGDAIGSGALSPNEARAKYYGLKPVPGGESPMVQQQYYSLEALATRDADQPFAKATPATPAAAPDAAPPVEDDEPDDTGIKGIAPFALLTALERCTVELRS